MSDLRLSKEIIIDTWENVSGTLLLDVIEVRYFDPDEPASLIDTDYKLRLHDMDGAGGLQHRRFTREYGDTADMELDRFWVVREYNLRKSSEFLRCTMCRKRFHEYLIHFVWERKGLGGLFKEDNEIQLCSDCLDSLIGERDTMTSLYWGLKTTDRELGYSEVKPIDGEGEPEQEEDTTPHRDVNARLVPVCVCGETHVNPYSYDQCEYNKELMEQVGNDTD
jgi:hypothetical protein